MRGSRKRGCFFGHVWDIAAVSGNVCDVHWEPWSWHHHFQSETSMFALIYMADLAKNVAKNMECVAFAAL